MTVGRIPWQRLSRSEKRITSIDELLEVTGLDWTVSRHPLISARTGAQVRNFSETVRDDTGVSLGVVGTHFRPIQNRDAFAALPDAMPAFGLKVAAGGMVYDGAQVWILTELRRHEFPTRILRNGEPDTIGEHLLFLNAHDGSSRAKVGAIPFAFFCANALARAWSAATVTVAVKHTSRGTIRLRSMT